MEWQFNQYRTIANDQNLILQKINTANTVNDFEVASPVPSDGWLTNGISGAVWTIVQNNTTLFSNSNMNLPVSGYQNTSFLSTTGNGDINLMLKHVSVVQLLISPRSSIIILYNFNTG